MNNKNRLKAFIFTLLCITINSFRASEKPLSTSKPLRGFYKNAYLSYPKAVGALTVGTSALAIWGAYRAYQSKTASSWREKLWKLWNGRNKQTATVEINTDDEGEFSTEEEVPSWYERFLNYWYPDHRRLDSEGEE